MYRFVYALHNLFTGICLYISSSQLNMSITVQYSLTFPTREEDRRVKFFTFTKGMFLSAKWIYRICPHILIFYNRTITINIIIPYWHNNIIIYSCITYRVIYWSTSVSGLDFLCFIFRTLKYAQTIRNKSIIIIGLNKMLLYASIKRVIKLIVWQFW